MDYEALTEALQKKKIAGAGLDVTDPEPLDANHPLVKMENVGKLNTILIIPCPYFLRIFCHFLDLRFTLPPSPFFVFFELSTPPVWAF